MAQLLPDGTAAAPADAPPQVQQAVWAANKIQDKPYVYGGGHADFEDNGYDCSGTVSYALHRGGLLETPLDSGSFMSWGDSGEGQWITVFTNPGHAYAVIAGLRLDTSAANDLARAQPAPVQEGDRARPPLAPDRALVARLQEASPRRLLARGTLVGPPLRVRRHRKGRCRGRNVRTVLHSNQSQDQPDARQG